MMAKKKSLFQYSNNDPRFTEENVNILHDLTDKVFADIAKIVTTPLQLAAQVSGTVGGFGLAAKVAAGLVTGVASLLASIRDQKDYGHRRPSDDDLLFICLMAYEAERSGADTKTFISNVHANFTKLTGRKARVPSFLEVRA